MRRQIVRTPADVFNKIDLAISRAIPDLVRERETGTVGGLIKGERFAHRWVPRPWVAWDREKLRKRLEELVLDTGFGFVYEESKRFNGGSFKIELHVNAIVVWYEGN